MELFRLNGGFFMWVRLRFPLTAPPKHCRSAAHLINGPHNVTPARVGERSHVQRRNQTAQSIVVCVHRARLLR